MWHLRLAQLPQRGALPLRHAVHGLAIKLMRECLQIHSHLLVRQRGKTLLREPRMLQHRLIHSLLQHLHLVANLHLVFVAHHRRSEHLPGAVCVIGHRARSSRRTHHTIVLHVVLLAVLGAAIEMLLLLF